MEDTRREKLAEQFEGVETVAELSGEQPEAPKPVETVRDESGRFAPRVKAEPQHETKPEVTGPAEEPVWRKPPASWKKEYHEYWSKADPKIQEYAWQREEQMRKGVEPLLSKAQFADEMKEAISPYETTIAGLGIKPAQAVKALMEADYTLRTSSPEQRVAYFQQLAQQYGVNLGGVQPAPAVDQNLYALQNQLAQVRGEVLTWKQQQEQQQNAVLLSEINDFAAKAEHFEDARPVMVNLLQSGLASTLDEAYDKAIRLDPALFERVQSAQQAAEQAKKATELNRAAKAARAAAVSVRSSTPGTNTAPKAQDRRSMLAEAFDGLADRV